VRTIRGVSVRDPRYDPRGTRPGEGAHAVDSRARDARPQARRTRSARGSGRPTDTRLLAGIGIFVLLFIAGVAFGGGVLGKAFKATPAGSPNALVLDLTASGDPGASDGSAGESPAIDTAASDDAGAAASDDGGAAAPTVDASAEPNPSDAPLLAETDVAIVPVANFRSARASVRAADVSGIAKGSSPFKALVLVKDDADAILAALGVDRDGLGKRLVLVNSAAALAGNLSANRTRLGFLRADDVGASVHALAWGGKAMFGNDRVASLAKWPLTARLSGPETPAYDPGKAWTLVAGGDVLLDRGVSLSLQAKGADFAFNGGTVEITGRCKDCSPMGWDLPYTRRTGNGGIVRSLFKDADLAIANFENPAPNNFRWHGKGTVFSANPKHIAALANAGIDWVSLANNHIGDAGRAGMLQTMKNLDKYKIAHGGLGKNRAAAHTATLLKAGGQTVAILGYDMIAPGYNATATVAGSARMTKTDLKRDIKAARKRGADVVVVFPHWGIEYRAAPSATQRAMGKYAIDAGADAVIGNHPHWAEGMEVYKGKPIWYALGNLVFDQTWSEYTMEGITLELTFQGKDIVQIRMRPHLILGKAQPNFMDPAASGKFVMDQVWKASKGLLEW
jgi:hypothetical protein